MKWNIQGGIYDWLVDLHDGTTFNMSVGILMTYQLTANDIKGMEGFKKNMLLLHGSVKLPWKTRLLLCFSC
jgi:hypothetical protein